MLDPAAADAEPGAARRASGDFERDCPLRCRDIDLGPVNRFGECDRDTDFEMVFVPGEVWMRGDADRQEQIAVWGAIWCVKGGTLFCGKWLSVNRLDECRLLEKLMPT